ncbi:NAD(P)-dependent oxidoreductase [Gordonia sp. CPCC 206044]|uniref:NAD-dependent epimerase/dehydratase family protein n=1 Tax=Gordonia sp. CPCC 206044 TaxID=3140793 RepID=UPI003AF401D8
MRLFVTGGTGAIGGHAVPALVAAGHEVRALARGEDKARTLAGEGAEPIAVSLFDRDGLAAAFDGCEAVVNLASALPSSASFVRRSAWAQCTRIRTEGSAAVVDAALRAGVERLVQESVVMIYRDQGDRWIDEHAEVDRYPIAEGNHAAEASARRFTDAAGAGVTLRFGLFYGPGAAHSEQFVAMGRRHVGVVFGHPDTYLSSIHLDDAASAVVAALSVPAGTYNIVDDEPVTRRVHADAIAHAVGADAWVRAPGRAALLLGDRTTSMTRSLRVDNGAFRSVSGWAPSHRSVREGYVSMVGQLCGG